jgi:SAM-dependent methyltransferase
MSRADREKWDARYARQNETAYEPSELLQDALSRMRQSRSDLLGLSVLDLACGGGRNSIWLAEQGFRVDAVDVSAEGLRLGQRRAAQRRAAGPGAADGARPGEIHWLQADLDDGLPVSGPYDLIVMIRYLDLPLLARAIPLLRPGGVLVVELHMESGGRAVAAPRNPDFLISPGELARTTRELTPWLLTEGLVESADGRREALVRFIGCVL